MLISHFYRAAAVTLGRPPLIRLADVNTPLPEEVEDVSHLRFHSQHYPSPISQFICQQYLITSEGIFEYASTNITIVFRTCLRPEVQAP